MVDNPYAPATPDAPQASTDSLSYRFKSTWRITQWLTGLLLFWAASTALTLFVHVLDILMVPSFPFGVFEQERLAAVVGVTYLISANASVVTYLVCVILFVWWTYRSTSNAHAIRPQDMRFTPGWSIAYWFIPIVNFFRPYDVVCAVHRVSLLDDSTDQPPPRPRCFVAWWFCWVVGIVLSRIAVSPSARSPEFKTVFEVIDLIASVLLIAAAPFVVAVIRRVSSTQLRRWNHMNARASEGNAFTIPISE